MATLLREFDVPDAAGEKRPQERPWGTVAPLAAGGYYRIRRLVVNPGARLHPHAHDHVAKQWVVVSGTGRVTRDEAIFTLAANDSVFIPPRAPHALENPGRAPLWVIEVEVGARLDERDA
jgi:mannose-1-phosphate guanylyltransferase / mannose-6-phosphate isomerase